MKNAKKPSWKVDNGMAHLKCVVKDRDIVKKQNDDLKKFLEGKGWEYWDFCNVYEHGPTWSFRKTKMNEGLQKSIISFDFHYDDVGFGPFWEGSLRGVFDFMPSTKTYHPQGWFEIRPIFQAHLDKFDMLENRVVHALRYLTVVE